MEKVEEKFNLDEDYDGVDLQLSLGPSKKLRRSASIVVESGGSSGHARGVAVEAHAPLGRTCSLPAVGEEEFRRRKEEQTARRLEARRKRMEKKNAAAAAGRGGVKEKERERESSSEDGSNNNGAVENNGVAVERSIGSSQRTGSSGVCDPPSQQIDQAQNTEVRSPAMAQPVQVPAPQQPQGKPPVPAERNVNGKRTVADMPYVSTREGNRIEGFLYRYRKGEEVKIVCVCHGLFLSPAEFVKHGGGGDVDNPLRHIVVNPSPPLV